VMSLYVFLREGVDVAILEVGIGGEYDCTNLVRWGTTKFSKNTGNGNYICGH